MTILALATPLASVLTEEMDPDQRTDLINNALPIAGLFALLLLIAMYFLWRSMNKQMKRIDPNLPAGLDDRQQARDRQYTAEAVARGQEPDDGDPK